MWDSDVCVTTPATTRLDKMRARSPRVTRLPLLLATLLLCTYVTKCTAKSGLVITDSRVYMYNFDDGSREELEKTVPGTLRAVDCVLATGHCVVGGSNGYLIHTENMGEDWDDVNPGGLTDNVESISCASSGLCVLAAKDEIWDSTDNGASWTLAYTGNDDFKGIACDTKACVAVGRDCEVAVRSNAGAGGSWSDWDVGCASNRREIDDDSELRDVAFPISSTDRLLLIASKEDGFGVGTETGKAQWDLDPSEDHSPGVSNDVKALACRPPLVAETESLCILASRGGGSDHLKASADAGGSWTIVDDNRYEAAHCLGDTCVAVSTDGRVAVLTTAAGDNSLSSVPASLTVHTDGGGSSYEGVSVIPDSTDEGLDEDEKTPGQVAGVVIGVLIAVFAVTGAIAGAAYMYNANHVPGRTAESAMESFIPASGVVPSAAADNYGPNRASVSTHGDRSSVASDAVMLPAPMSTVGVVYSEAPVSVRSQSATIPDSVAYTEASFRGQDSD